MKGPVRRARAYLIVADESYKGQVGRSWFDRLIMSGIQKRFVLSLSKGER